MASFFPKMHIFSHVFEPDAKPATPARTEDYWDIDPENLLAVRHHNYPRRRLYVPNEDDARIFPTPRRYTVVAKSDKCILDNSNETRDRNLKELWSGETYFDLAGRDQESFELAVAATRKGKPIRKKSEAKKEVKQSKFVTPSQDQKEQPGVMFKPVTRVTYDMKDFLDSCVERYCELAKVDRKTLKPAVTPFHEHRTSRLLIGEEEKAGRLQPITSRVLRKILFAARMAKWDLLRELQAAHTERLAEQNRQVTARNRATPKASIPAAAPTYRGYTQEQWDEWNRNRRYTQAEWVGCLAPLPPLLKVAHFCKVSAGPFLPCFIKARFGIITS